MRAKANKLKPNQIQIEPKIRTIVPIRKPLLSSISILVSDIGYDISRMTTPVIVITMPNINKYIAILSDIMADDRL